MIDKELLTMHTKRLASRIREIAEAVRAADDLLLNDPDYPEADATEAAELEGIARAIERLPEDSES